MAWVGEYLAARERSFCARPQDGRAPAPAGDRRAGVTPEAPIPGHPGPGGWGLSRPRGFERWTPMRHASAPSLFSPARRGAGAAIGCGAVPRLLLLLGQLNRDFVKRDR